MLLRAGLSLMLASSPPPPLGLATELLLSASDSMVAAAAVLGENQRQEEEPGRLSACGCALGNAARELELFAHEVCVAREWESATAPLAAAAACLSTAAAAVDGFLDDGDALQANRDARPQTFHHPASEIAPLDLPLRSPSSVPPTSSRTRRQSPDASCWPPPRGQTWTRRAVTSRLPVAPSRRTAAASQEV